jgi:hypothetical protein
MQTLMARPRINPDFKVLQPLPELMAGQPSLDRKEETFKAHTVSGAEAKTESTPGKVRFQRDYRTTETSGRSDTGALS